MTTKGIHLTLGRERLPDFLCISFVVTIATLIPKTYHRIPFALLRVVFALVAMIAMFSTGILLFYRLYQRHKKEGQRHLRRSGVVIVVTLLLAMILARAQVADGMSSGLTGAYAIQTNAFQMSALYSSVIFALLSQLLCSSICGIWDDMQGFVLRLVKALGYIGIPLAIISFVLTACLPSIVVLRVVITIALWSAAIFFNEKVDGAFGTDVLAFIKH